MSKYRLNSKLAYLTQGLKDYTNLLYDLKHEFFDVMNIENNLAREFWRAFLRKEQVQNLDEFDN